MIKKGNINCKITNSRNTKSLPISFLFYYSLSFRPQLWNSSPSVLVSCFTKEKHMNFFCKCKLTPAFPRRAEKEFHSKDMFKGDRAGPSASASREQEGSSAESGDSEIELVSEEPPKFAQPPKSKVAFSQPNKPFDSPPAAPPGCSLAGSHAPPTAYSILREEREAELDSDLFIESASEESPKREQGFGGSPSPLAPSAVSPRSPSEPVPAGAAIAEKVKTPGKSEEGYPVKPKPPTAAVPPEIRSERLQQDDMHVNSSEGKGDPGNPATAVFTGFNKQKGQFL